METTTLIEKLGKLRELGGHAGFYNLLLDMAELHARKNNDYSRKGNPLSNLKKSEAIGIVGWKNSILRMTDKWSRIENFALGKEMMVKTESFKDALLDNAVYSLLTILLYEDSIK